MLLHAHDFTRGFYNHQVRGGERSHRERPGALNRHQVRDQSKRDQRESRDRDQRERPERETRERDPRERTERETRERDQRERPERETRERETRDKHWRVEGGVFVHWWTQGSMPS